MNIQIEMNHPSGCWIGLAEVRPSLGNDALDGSAGAFVPVVGKTGDLESFYLLVKNKLSELGFELLELDDVEPLSERLAKISISDDLIHAISELSETNRMVYGTFHAYDE